MIRSIVAGPVRNAATFMSRSLSNASPSRSPIAGSSCLTPAVTRSDSVSSVPGIPTRMGWTAVRHITPALTERPTDGLRPVLELEREGEKSVFLILGYSGQTQKRSEDFLVRSDYKTSLFYTSKSIEYSRGFMDAKGTLFTFGVPIDRFVDVVNRI
ncbi:hypothetical protein EBR96_04115, partial [bacterium]|nr:hypothetical protein [bacterium]